MDDRFPAPEHLSDRSKALWAEVVPRRRRSPGALAMVEEALTALDRADQARAALPSAGLVTVTESTKAVHVNPLVKVERECRQQFARIWSDLHLNYDDGIDGVRYEAWLQRQGADA